MSKQSLKAGKLKMSRRKKLLFAGLAALFGVTLLEGFATWFAVGSDLVQNWKQPAQVGVLSEERHCQYDEEFGWANKPETVIADFYGPEMTISINSQGFRGLENYDAMNDAYRLICLGDSFTLGYGVDDRETFPFQLQQNLKAGTQVVNMGQGGYSVGQSYLWLKRSAPELKPDLVVCVFIVEDFRRLNSTLTGNGFSTPQFEVENGSLVVSNIPVPKKLQAGETLSQNFAIAESLTNHSMLAKGIAKMVSSEKMDADEHALFVALHLLRETSRICNEMNCPMVVALTPTLPELFDPASSLKYQQYSDSLKSFLKTEGIPFHDLRPAFQNLDSETIFLDEKFHHYSAEGNRVVAEALANWLPYVVGNISSAVETESQ